MCIASTFEAQNWGHSHLISDKADVILKHSARSGCITDSDEGTLLTMLIVEHVAPELAIR
jgi:hypothetical protein